MMLPALLLGACIGVPADAAERPPEEALRILLADVRQQHVQETRAAVLGSADELRDSVATESGPAQKSKLNRFPGMAADPFNVCRELSKCPEAPLSMHVEDQTLVNDAFIAMARPWLDLQKERGKDVIVSVDAGLGVQLRLQDLPGLGSVTLEASPAPTGGFDITLGEGEPAARIYAKQRAALLAAKPAA